MTEGSTGPNGRIFATTPYGLYSIPEGWADRHMPTLSALCDFLVTGASSEWGLTIARLHQLADADPEQREVLRELHLREDAALYHWQNTPAAYPIKDAHGPTMRQLLDALNEAGQ